MRGGILAIIERITDFIPETWLIVICLAPGMGFAIPINMVGSVADQMMKNDEARRNPLIF